jgi:hypothetical protein
MVVVVMMMMVPTVPAVSTIATVLHLLGALGEISRSLNDRAIHGRGRAGLNAGEAETQGHRGDGDD